MLKHNLRLRPLPHDAMKLTNVKLIFAREVRDQLRDRRTLLLIVALPLFLYPLLGTSLFQISQFVHEQVTRGVRRRRDNLPGKPPLFENGRFAGRLFADAGRARLLDLRFAPPNPSGDACRDPRAYARAQVQSGRYAASLCFPPTLPAGSRPFTGRCADAARSTLASDGAAALTCRALKLPTTPRTTSRGSPLTESTRRWRNGSSSCGMKAWSKTAFRRGWRVPFPSWP